MEEFIFKKETYRIIGACINVHNELVCGFLKAIYQEALGLEFLEQGVPPQMSTDKNFVHR